MGPLWELLNQSPWRARLTCWPSLSRGYKQVCRLSEASPCPYLIQNAAGPVDRRTEMVQLATELLSEQIRPVRIVSISDVGGEPQGEFVSNQMRFTFKFTKGGMVTYQPKTQGGRGDSDLQARIERMKTRLGASR